MRWITCGHTNHPLIKGLLLPTITESASFRNSASKINWITGACYYIQDTFYWILGVNALTNCKSLQRIIIHFDVIGEHSMSFFQG